MIVSVYRVPQMQGVGRADVLLYFKCPPTKQMRCAVNAYDKMNKVPFKTPNNTAYTPFLRSFMLHKVFISVYMS